MFRCSEPPLCPGGQRLERNSVEMSILEDVERMRSIVLKRKQETTDPACQQVLLKPPADRKYFNPAQKYLQQLDQLGGQLRTVQESVARVAAAAESAGVMDIERRLQVETAVTVTSVSVSM